MEFTDEEWSAEGVVSGGWRSEKGAETVAMGIIGAAAHDYVIIPRRYLTNIPSFMSLNCPVKSE